MDSGYNQDAKREEVIEKEFVEQYRFYDIYKIVDGKRQILFNASMDNPAKKGVTHTGSTLAEIKQSIDSMYEYCKKLKLNIRG